MTSEIPGLLQTFAIYVALVAAWLRIAVKLRIAHDADRVVFATALLPVTLVAATLVLGRAGTLTRLPLVALLCAFVALALRFATTGVRGVEESSEVPKREANAAEVATSRWLRAVLFFCAALPLAAAFAASALLETWAWDSLGYHLPIAHDAVQVGRLREVPGHLAYIETYPRFADLVTTAHRILLGHERFVELSQWPFLPLLVAVGFRIARRLGVARASAWAIAAAPLALPIVYLQCATSYVDVAYAALLLGGLAYAADRDSRVHDLFAAGLLGLALATKPSAPASLVAGLGALAALALVRRSPRAVWPLAWIGVGAALVGAKVYVDNLVRFGNPVWPVVLRLGERRLPGYVSQEWILALGVTEEEQRWSWIRKLVTSWFLETRPYVFDMRFGGFGVVFAYVALPLAIVACWRSARIRPLLVAVAAASLAQAGAFTSRYTIALAALVLTVAGAAVAGAAPRSRRVLQGVFAATLVVSMVRGLGGYTDGGPSLVSLVHMSERERAARVALDEHGSDWFDMREETRPGEAFGYDKSFGLPSLALRPDGRSRLVFLGDTAPDGAELEAIVDRERIRFLAIDRSVPRVLSSRFRMRFTSSFDGAMIVEVVPSDEPAISANP